MPGASEYGVDDGVRTHDRRSHNPVLYQLSYAHHIALLVPETKLMAHPAGFEPATIRLEGGCSIQLSYGRFYLHSMERRLQAPTTEDNLLKSSYPAAGCARQAGRILRGVAAVRQQQNEKKFIKVKGLRQLVDTASLPDRTVVRECAHFIQSSPMVNQAS